jgi:hypothetical protein
MRAPSLIAGSFSSGSGPLSEKPEFVKVIANGRIVAVQIGDRRTRLWYR